MPSQPVRAAGAAAWARYLPGRTAWNSVRVVSVLAAMLAFVLALAERWAG